MLTHMRKNRARKSRDLFALQQLMSLNQISIRAYYLYYRLLEGLSEQRESFLSYAFYTAIAIIGGFGVALNAIILFQQIGGIIKLTILILTIAVIAGLLIIKGHFVPGKKLAELRPTLRLAIHLDRVVKHVGEISLLKRALKHDSDNELIEDMQKSAYKYLSDSLAYIKQIVKELKEKEILEQSMKEIHVNEDIINSRIKLAEKTLGGV